MHQNRKISFSEKQKQNGLGGSKKKAKAVSLDRSFIFGI